MTSQSLAAAVGAGMYERDYAAQMLGITLEAVGPGTATMRLTVRPDMVNGHDICHGGIIFTLADTAFAYACNSHNIVTVAQHCTITFLTPAKTGDVLIATAEEKVKTGRNGVTDIVVAKEDGSPVATFRGNSVTLKQKVVPDLEDMT